MRFTSKQRLVDARPSCAPGPAFADGKWTLETGRKWRSLEKGVKGESSGSRTGQTHEPYAAAACLLSNDDGESRG